MLRPRGSVVGDRYEILRTIAKGGMSAVYEAQHRVSKKRVALKVVDAEFGGGNTGNLQRFLREASAPAEIGHAGIVEVFDGGIDDDGSLFLAMELLVGESLRDRIASCALTRTDAIALVAQLLDPLSAAHEKRFVHRDLKPENVMLVRDELGRERIKLLDFGIARQVNTLGPTVTNTGIGTPHYMSPEQATSARGVTPAADVWSVGVILYEMLSGELPFEGETSHAVVIAACTKPHKPVRRAAPDLPGPIADIIETCLAKQPEDRFADAGALRSTLIRTCVVLGYDLPQSESSPGSIRAPIASTMEAPRADSPPPPSTHSDVAGFASSPESRVLGTPNIPIHVSETISTSVPPSGVAPSVSAPRTPTPGPSSSGTRAAIEDRALRDPKRAAVAKIPTERLVRDDPPEAPENESSLSPQTVSTNRGRRAVAGSLGAVLLAVIVMAVIAARSNDASGAQRTMERSLPRAAVAATEPREVRSVPTPAPPPSEATAPTVAELPGALAASVVNNVAAPDEPPRRNGADERTTRPVATRPESSGGELDPATRDLARGCVQRGDLRCVVDALHGTTSREGMSMLFAAYDGRGEVRRAVSVARNFVNRYPRDPQAPAFRTYVDRHPTQDP